jgi:GDP-4-dehydro-6-deoxy-D-mannose reductase
MHLFLTGITGFVGSRLAREQVARGEPVSGIHVNGPAPGAGRRGLGGRPARPRRARPAPSTARPEAVVHLGGLSHVGASWGGSATTSRSTCWAPRTCWRPPASGGAGGLRLVCRGLRRRPRATSNRSARTAAAAPASPYALTKAAAERTGAGRRRRGRALLQPGRCRPGTGVRAAQLRPPAGGRRPRRAPPVLRVGNLSARRDFVHVADGAAAYRLLAERGEPGTTYNIASGEAVSIRQALDRLMAIAGVDVRRSRSTPSGCGRSTCRCSPARRPAGGLGWRRRTTSTTRSPSCGWRRGSEATGDRLASGAR